MNEIIYLLDNNIIGRLGRARLQSEFVSKHCRVTDEVLYEAGPDRRALLDEIRLPTTGETLDVLKTIMQSIPIGDTALVDLYRNKGAADPLMVASAIIAERDSAQLLFGPKWVIATEDSAVRTLASAHGIGTVSFAELRSLIT